jgi:hypothetical protein
MRLLPSCREVQSELTEFSEGTLPFRRRVGIWIHLLFCQVCAGVLRGLKALPGMVKRSLGPPEAAPEAATKTLAEVQATLAKRKDS